MDTNLGQGTGAGGDRWLEQELRGCDFGDERLNRRFRRLVEQLAGRIGGSIPWACEDWANAKAAYRFFSNGKVGEGEILAGHFDSTCRRVPAGDSPLLLLHDTTEFSFHRRDPGAVGIRHRLAGRRSDTGDSQDYVSCGIAMHSSLAVTVEGLPLGLAAIKFWTRSEFKGCNSLKRKINPTRVPIEAKESIRWLENLRQSTALLATPGRCVHIGDRESDIFELFSTAHKLGTHFLVRTCVDRLCGDGGRTVASAMTEAPLQGLHRVTVRDRNGRPSVAVVELRYRRIVVLPPIGKQKLYPSLTLTVIHAVERGAPDGRERVEWKLLTDLPVRSRREAVEKLQWYAMRWKIETYHKILKSGCRVEAAKLRTADRLVNLTAICCVLSWRVFWTTMLNRTAPRLDAGAAFTPIELRILDALIQDHTGDPSPRTGVGRYITKLARLGGYLARARDSPPGNEIIWRGWVRLTDIHLGVSIGTKLVGN
ncbi:MAG: IS4 family transposase [Terriglobales bacterium]